MVTPISLAPFKADTSATTEGGADKPAVPELASGIVSASRNAGSERMIGLSGKELPVAALSFLLSKGFRTCLSEFQRVSVITREK